MRLIETLTHQATVEESPFRAQLLREDVARLKKLQELARSGRDLAAFKTTGMRIGWTQGDARTHELQAPLDRFLEVVFRYETGEASEALETALEETWFALHRLRLERLLGCLSTPVPRPID